MEIGQIGIRKEVDVGQQDATEGADVEYATEGAGVEVQSVVPQHQDPVRAESMISSHPSRPRRLRQRVRTGMCQISDLGLISL